MVYVSPYDDGDDGNETSEQDGYMKPDASYCQIYDDSYRTGDVSVRKDNKYANPAYSSNNMVFTNWQESNNYQQIYGMDKLYHMHYERHSYSGGDFYQSTSNPRVFGPFTPYFIGRNWFCSTYETDESPYPKTSQDETSQDKTSQNETSQDEESQAKAPHELADGRLASTSVPGYGVNHYAVSGSQAKLLKPVIRHWSEVADSDRFRIRRSLMNSIRNWRLRLPLVCLRRTSP